MEDGKIKVNLSLVDGNVVNETILDSSISLRVGSAIKKVLFLFPFEFVPLFVKVHFEFVPLFGKIKLNTAIKKSAFRKNINSSQKTRF